MAYAIGTADDWIDMARKLRDYADGTIDPTAHADFSDGGQVPMAERWTVETNGGGQPTLPASGNASDGEVYLTGPGGGSDEIHVQYRTYRDTDIFNWEIRGATAFSDSELFEDQLQISDETHYALGGSTMNIWFLVNGRRIVAVAQSGTITTCMHMGFVKQFPAISQWPYPLLVAGSVRNSSLGITVNNFSHSCFPDPAFEAAWVRFADGVWYRCSNYSGVSTLRAHTAVSCIAPYDIPGYSNPDISGSGGSHSPSELVSQDQIWRSFSASSLRIGSGFTGEQVLFPCTLLLEAPDPQDMVAAEIDGLYALYGESGVSTGDTITIGSDTYVVFQNTWRSEFADFFAIKLE